jgi:hypothetical protein
MFLVKTFKSNNKSEYKLYIFTLHFKDSTVIIKIHSNAENLKINMFWRDWL